MALLPSYPHLVLGALQAKDRILLFIRHVESTKMFSMARSYFLDRWSGDVGKRSEDYLTKLTSQKEN